MNHAERAFVIFYWVYMFVYIPYFIVVAVTGLMDHYFFYGVMPFHFVGMLMGIPMLIVVFRDLYKRSFPNPNSKITWTILMLMFWPSILAYLYRHGFRPRERHST